MCADDLAERTGDSWLAAAPGVKLGIPAVLPRSLDEVRGLLEEALRLSLAVLRPVEADLVGRVRQRLGEERFHQAFTAGPRLSERQAVGIVREQPRTEAP
jgi:hypothetical protein